MNEFSRTVRQSVGATKSVVAHEVTTRKKLNTNERKCFVNFNDSVEDGICNHVHRSDLFIHHIVANTIVLWICFLCIWWVIFSFCVYLNIGASVCLSNAFILCKFQCAEAMVKASILIIITIDNNNNDGE